MVDLTLGDLALDAALSFQKMPQNLRPQKPQALQGCAYPGLAYLWQPMGRLGHFSEPAFERLSVLDVSNVSQCPN